MSKYIDAVGQAYQEIQEKLMTSAERAKEMQKQADAAKKKASGQAAKAGMKIEDNTNDKSDDGEGLDKVQPKAVKKKFKDRKDKDIDNDGDTDSSDEYLHKRRKAISKKSKDKEGDVEMNPKLDKESTQKESKIRSALKAILSEKKDVHYKGATKPEEMQDKLSGKGAKDMVNQPVSVDDTEEKGHDDASKAGRVTKPASARNGGDNVRSGDQKIKKVKESKVSNKSIAEAYASMYEAKMLKHGQTKPIENSIKKIEREVANLKKFGLQDEGRDEKETKELTDELNKEYTDAINKIMSGCGEVRELLY